MIRLYHGQTPNVFKVTIALHELGLAYEEYPVNITKGEQFAPEFLKVSPNNRIPAILDIDPVEGGEGVAVFESGAILFYLAEKTGRLMPTGLRDRARVMQWVMWQMAGQGPTSGQLGHFRNYAPEPLPYAIDRFSNEAHRLYRVLDEQLAENEYVAGEYSIADIACWPWLLFRHHHALDLGKFSNVERWFGAIGARPAVQEALKDAAIGGPAQFTDEMRKILFMQR